jgi:glycosyltransferase involved in cell wall biosynthesis
MKVSVVVPTRNRSALLATTLRSALAQRDVDLEVIIVDEASTDDTAAVIGRFGDSRIRVIRHEKPQGVSVARNRGAAEAHGEWIAFLDDDDLWAPDKLALQVQAARDSDAQWVYVGHVNINMGYKVTGGAPPLCPSELMMELPKHNVVPGGCSGVAVSRRGFAAAGMFDPGLQPLADWDLWLRLAQVGVPAWVPRPLVAYRVHGEQMSLDTARVEAEFRILSNRNPAASPAILYRYLGWWALRVKNHRSALRLFVRAWLQRRPEYCGSMLATDLVSLSRDVLEHRLRIGVGGPQPSALLAEDHRSWRSEAQVWVDALVASQAADGGSTLRQVGPEFP